MFYLAFALNTLIIAVLVFELQQGRKERQSLALLIKSRDVAEFVRAERSLSASVEVAEPKEPDSVDLDDPSVDPEDVLRGIGSPTPQV